MKKIDEDSERTAVLKYWRSSTYFIGGSKRDRAIAWEAWKARRKILET